jgi:site-specific DNA recombinase
MSPRIPSEIAHALRIMCSGVFDAYPQSLIDVIEVDDTQILIKGGKDVLERAVLASRSGVIRGSQMSTEWRTRRDSNPWPLPSEGSALSS